MRLKLHTVQQPEVVGYSQQSTSESLAIGIAGASAVGDSPQAPLPGWSLGADEVEGFNQGARGAGADPLKE